MRRATESQSEDRKRVLVITRFVLTWLRQQRFFGFNELNRALQTLLLDLNQLPFKMRAGYRARVRAETDQPALRPRPQRRYVYDERKVASFGVDYHVGIVGHYCRVPREHARQGRRAREPDQRRSLPA